MYGKMCARQRDAREQEDRALAFSNVAKQNKQTPVALVIEQTSSSSKLTQTDVKTISHKLKYCPKIR
jgi:hypothetical protein